MGLMYKSVSFADSPLNLTSTGLDAINANQNSLILDINATGGAIVINLPSITSLVFGNGSRLNASGTLIGGGTFSGGGGMSFYINGTRIAGLAPITFNAYNVNTLLEVDQDIICGQASFGVPAVLNACFTLFISGRHSWCAMSCGLLT
jgi:hypothetical protein